MGMLPQRYGENRSPEKESTTLLNNQVLIISVFSSEKEDIAHVKTAFGADIGALTAEDTLVHPDADSFRFLYELDGVGGADLDAQVASDAPVPLILYLSPELRWCRHRGNQGCLAGSDLLQERGDRWW